MDATLRQKGDDGDVDIDGFGGDDDFGDVDVLYEMSYPALSPSRSQDNLRTRTKHKNWWRPPRKIRTRTKHKNW